MNETNLTLLLILLIIIATENADRLYSWTLKEAAFCKLILRGRR